MITDKTLDEMERHAVALEAQAAAIRTAIAVMADAGTRKARARLPATLRAASAVRATVNGSGAHGDAPRGRPRIHAPRRHEPGQLVKKQLTAFLLSALKTKPHTTAELLALLRSVGHPVKTNGAINGPLSKLNQHRYVKRLPTGAFRLTAKGARHVAELSATAATGDAATAAP